MLQASFECSYETSVVGGGGGAVSRASLVCGSRRELARRARTGINDHGCAEARKRPRDVVRTRGPIDSLSRTMGSSSVPCGGCGRRDDGDSEFNFEQNTCTPEFFFVVTVVRF